MKSKRVEEVPHEFAPMAIRASLSALNQSALWPWARFRLVCLQSDGL